MEELINYIVEMNAKTLAWVNEDPTNRMAGLLSEDPRHWAGYDIFSVSDFELYMARNELYELFKEVYGTRPRFGQDFNTWNLEQVNSYIKFLSDYHESTREEREADEELYAEEELIGTGNFSKLNNKYRDNYTTEQAPLGSLALILG